MLRTVLASQSFKQALTFSARNFIYIPPSPPPPPPPSHNWTQNYYYAPYISQVENEMRRCLQWSMSADELDTLNTAIGHGVVTYKHLHYKVTAVSAIFAASVVPLDMFYSPDSFFYTAPAWAVCHYLAHRMYHSKFQDAAISKEKEIVQASNLTLEGRARVTDYLWRTSRWDIYYHPHLYSLFLTGLFSGFGLGFVVIPIVTISILQ